MTDAHEHEAVTTLRFDRSWRSFTAVQGGVLLGHLVSRSADVPRRRCAVQAVSAHFLSAVAVDTDAEVELRPDRLGSTSSVRAELWQEGVRRVVAQVLLVPVAEGAPGAHPFPGPAPDLAGPDEGEPVELPPDYVPVGQKYEIRALGPERPLGGGRRPELTAWVRLRDATVRDPLVQLGIVVDALPPSLFAIATTPLPMVTVELTMHLFGMPPGIGAWMHVHQRTEYANDAVCVDEAALHDERGHLVARARQTRRILAARRTP